MSGLYLEHWGRAKGQRAATLPEAVEEDFIAEVQRLRAKVDYQKTGMSCFKKGTAGEKAQVISKLRHKHTLSDKYLEAKTAITAIYQENKGRYDYRRITEELHRRGYGLNQKTAQRLMKEPGRRVRMKKYHVYKGEVGKIAPNLLERNFEAEKPNQKWVTDLTECNLFG